MKKFIALILSVIMIFGLISAVSAEEDDIMKKYNTPFERGTVGSELFRIPSIITLKDGSVLAAADMRHSHGLDSPNNLDTLTAKPPDGYSDWEYNIVNYFDDYPDGADNRNSASFIDPALVQSEKTGRIFLLTDVFPSGGGAPNAERGTGCIEINGKKYLALTDGDDITDFKKFGYYISDFEKGFARVLKISDSSDTGYSVDAEYNLYKDGAPALMKQEETGKTINQNVFYIGADFTLFKTMHLRMRYSDDNGKTWSSPMILTQSVKAENETFLGVGPGKGFTTEYNGKERIIFCVYDNAGGAENVSTIYSDDNGMTWRRGNETRVRAGLKKTSEAQIVSLPDGTLRMFARCGENFIAYGDSTDGGVTWSKFRADTGFGMTTENCMVSFINYSKKINGKSVIIGSSGSNTKERGDGIVKVGLIGDNNIIDWLTAYHVNSGFYGYSCLTELSDGNAALLYEDEWYHIAYMILKISDDGKIEEVNGNNIVYEKNLNFFQKIGEWFRNIIVKLQILFNVI